MGRNRTPSAPLQREQEAWLLAAAAPTLALHLFHAPYWLWALASLILLWRAETWWQRRPMPSRWLVMLVAFIVLFAVLAYYKRIFGREPGVALLIAFLALKTFEMRGLRDGWVCAFLCYFLVFTAFFHSQAPVTAAAAVATLLMVTAAMASLITPSRPMADQLRLAGRIMLQSLPFMLAMFVLFPRISGPLWGLPSDAFGARTGLSDIMSPGDISQLILSDEIAFRAKFETTPPSHPERYWRGPVMDHFDGRAWHAGTRAAARFEPPLEAGEGYRYVVTLEPHNRRWLFALELPVEQPPDSRLSPHYQLLSRMPVRSRMNYEVRSVTGQRWGKAEDQQTLNANRDLPRHSNPRARALAQSWRRELADDEAIVQRMLSYFREQPFAYTIEPPPLGEHSVDEFVFDTRRGFCEHYSSSFAFMMRAAGVPARVVTGYLGGEINQADGYMTVRQSDAHAWAEVWLRGKGWIRVDPTAAIAPGRIESGIRAAIGDGGDLPFMAGQSLPWLRAWRLRWEALSNGWNQWVLGYNAQRQREVLTRLGMNEPDWRSMTVTLTSLCAVLVSFMVVWVLHHRRRLDPALQAWNQLSRKLAREGLGRHPWEGPLDYARRVGAAAPALACEMKAIASLYVASRYARHADPRAVRELTTRVKRLKAKSTS